MKSIVDLDGVIGVVDGALAALDSILMNEQSKLLSEAFTCIDRGLNVLCEARSVLMLRSEQER
jgi:hypothetical protein